MPRFYTGIGSRSTPRSILKVMEELSKYLSHKGWTLRSGGARGADSAFERYAKGKDIYYSADTIDKAITRNRSTTENSWRHADKQLQSAVSKAEYDRWVKQGGDNDYILNLQRRNVFQITGPTGRTETPGNSSFVIAYTPGGSITGGTGVTLRIARSAGIDIVNLGSAQYQTIINGHRNAPTSAALEILGTMQKHIGPLRNIDALTRRRIARTHPTVSKSPSPISITNKRDPGPKLPTFYIGRPSILGNPFRGGSKAKNIADYRAWINNQLIIANPTIIAELNRLKQAMKKGPICLQCWCAPAACHGDVLKEILDRPNHTKPLYGRTQKRP